MSEYMKNKVEIRLLGKISITSDVQDPQAKCTARPPGEEGSGDRGHAQTPEPGPLGHLPRSWRVPCPLLTRSVRAVHTEQDLLTLECSRRTTCWPWTRTVRSSSSTQSRSPRC